MIIVGLGNPGKEYENTRHNIGFMFLDTLIKPFNLQFKIDKKANALVATTVIKGEKHYFLKPLTYMNLSGNAVASFVNYYHLEKEEILVIHDDMDLPTGKIRIRFRGSSGGHNGIKSLINCLHTEEFNRIRIGIGHEDKNNVIDFVLSKFNQQELELLDEVLQKAPKIILDYLEKGINYIMNNYN